MVTITNFKVILGVLTAIILYLYLEDDHPYQLPNVLDVLFPNMKYKPAPSHDSKRILYSGEIRHFKSGYCIDAPITDKPAEMYECHGLGGNQFWEITVTGEIRRNDFCLDHLPGVITKEVIYYRCHGNGGHQKWKFYNHVIKHVHSDLCLTVQSALNNYDLIVEECYNETGNPEKVIRNQQWILSATH